MAFQENESDEYVPSSDSSNDDEYEEEQRPNRWTGQSSTWQHLNRTEIDTLVAINQIRNQDLSVHLYNAFTLRHRHDEGDSKGVKKPVPNKVIFVHITIHRHTPKVWSSRDADEKWFIQDINKATGQFVREDKWVPPRSWTAWPLPAATVPLPTFMKPMDDEDEHFTFRKEEPYVPADELEEVISATMLKYAKERFRARQLAQPGGADALGSDLESSDEDSVGSARWKPKSRSTTSSRVSKDEDMSEGERMDVDVDDDGESSETRSSNRKSGKPLLMPVVATDDELSYDLLRPSARRIRDTLDTTLVILHNVQESKRTCPSDSDTSSTSSFSMSRSRSRSQSRAGSRSRAPRRSSPRQSEEQRLKTLAKAGISPSSELPKRRMGRPKKMYPKLEGETEREYIIRVARIQKKPRPVFSEDDSEPMSDSAQVPDSKAKGKGNARARAASNTRRARTRSVARREVSEAQSDDTSTGDGEPGKRKNTGVRLRDWRDILGAAALAGFPASALDRAARRCADLFGESFALHSLEEDQTTSDKRVRYDRGMIMVPSDAEEEGEEIGFLLQKQLQQRQQRASRATSIIEGEDDGRGRGRGRSTSIAPRKGGSQSPSRSPSPADVFFCVLSDCPRAVQPFSRRTNLVRHLRLVHKYDGEYDGRGRSASVASRKSRSQSRSRSASAGDVFFCLISNCPRAVDPFNRRANLMRHLKLVHQYEGDDLPVEVDSEDEMHGAVHVDGFLKPIKPRRGWRTGDVSKEKEKRRPQTKRRELPVRTRRSEDEGMRHTDSPAAVYGDSD